MLYFFIFETVKLRDIKIGLCTLFISIFLIKMAISIAPVFLELNKKTVNAVILQQELETKSDKEDPGKDALKEKKFFDEDFTSLIEHKPLVVEINVLHNLENSLYIQVYHPVVPTPPPNV